MFTVKIVSNFSTLVGCQDKKLLLDSSKALKLKSNFEFPIILEIFPTDPVLSQKRLIPYCVTLSNNNGVLNSNSTVTDLIKFSSNSYVLKLNELFVTSQTNILYQEMNSGAFVSVNSDGNILVNSGGEIVFNRDLKTVLKKAEAQDLSQNYYSVLVVSTDEIGKVFVFNFKNELLIEKPANRIEKIDGGFQTLLINNDIVKSGFVSKFKIDNGVELLEEYSVYINDGPRQDYNLLTVPIVFLQSVKAKNFEFAKSLLSPILQQKVSAENLESFFGDFNEITTDAPDFLNENEFVLTYGNEEKSAKIFKFSVRDDIIVNIA